MRPSKFTHRLPTTQADICRIANLLRQLIWRQNHCALKNARKGRSDLDDDDFVSEVFRLFSEQSPPISSRRRSTQRRTQLSHGPVLDKPTLDRSASWENDEDGGNHGTFTKVYNASVFGNTRLLLTTPFEDRHAERHTVSNAPNASTIWTFCFNRLNGLTNTRIVSSFYWHSKQTLSGERKSSADNTSCRYICRSRELQHGRRGISKAKKIVKAKTTSSEPNRCLT